MVVRVEVKAGEQLPSNETLQRCLSESPGGVVVLLDQGDHRQPEEVEAELKDRMAGVKVFASGMKQVTLMRTVLSHSVLSHKDQLVKAIVAYVDSMRTLMVALSSSLGIKQKDILFALKDGQLDDTGIVGEWKYAFHGQGCCFTHLEGGASTEVVLDDQGLFNRIDPSFLAQYISKRDEWIDLHDLFNNDFHNACQVLNVLVDEGVVQEDQEGFYRLSEQ